MTHDDAGATPNQDGTEDGTEAAGARTLWLGRGRLGDGPEVALRVWTDGAAPGPRDTLEHIDDPFAIARARGLDPHAVARAAPCRERAPFERGSFAPPVQPTKILGIGRNFRAHAQELGNDIPDAPLLFFKPPSCLLATGETLRLPREHGRVDFEGELVVVIGRRARVVARGDAWRHVAGYTLGNDVSCRALQRAEPQWARAKGFDGFGPIGAFIRVVPPGWELPAATVELRTEVDGVERQRAPLSAMVWSVPALVEHISACMTLEPGDLIFTGTPAGVGPLAPGQRVDISCTGLALSGPSTPVA